MSEGDSLLVTVPDKNCVLGDKLTAFAPHTTGIPFGIDKELEIIKQMFDCWTLLQEMDDYQTVAAVYDHVAQVEAGPRFVHSAKGCASGYDTKLSLHYGPKWDSPG